ncbi:hypothetical protein SUGI_0489220 [Cryptomeria japonica]|nr:hypothetical protein SUGI_0489220 [Cryptomeria japonica]
MGENLISSNDDYYPEFVLSTQVNNAELVTEEVIIEKEMTTNEVEVTKTQYHVDPQTKTGVCWSIVDTMVLMEAKRIEKETQSNSGAMRKTLNFTKKSKIIQEYCFSHGVASTKNQCRDRWEHLQPEYKKITNYENNIPLGHDNYWNMTSQERIEKKHLTKFIVGLYDAMENTFGKYHAINPGNVTIDSSDTNLHLIKIHQIWKAMNSLKMAMKRTNNAQGKNINQFPM